MSKKGTQQVWNGVERKVVIFAIEATGLQSKKNESIEAYMKIVCGKSTPFKSKTASKTPDPYWGEFYYFNPSTNDLNSSATVSVWNNKLIDRCLGQCTIKLSDLEKERVYDMWCELKPRKEKGQEKPCGKVHLRVYISFMKESLPIGRMNQFHTFHYDHYWTQFKTGDLVCFGGVGIVSTLIKLYTNSEYFSVGIVLQLPNKYTENEDLFVLEVTRNIDGLFDPFSDTAKVGVAVFRLAERVHQFHGNGVWLCPLRSPLSQLEEARMKAKIWSLWSAEDPFTSFKKSYPEVNQFLTPSYIGKTATDACELFSPSMIGSIFREAGLPMNIAEVAATASDIINQEIFAPPFPLRVQKLAIPFDLTPTPPLWNPGAIAESLSNDVNNSNSGNITFAEAYATPRYPAQYTPFGDVPQNYYQAPPQYGLQQPMMMHPGYEQPPPDYAPQNLAAQPTPPQINQPLPPLQLPQPQQMTSQPLTLQQMAQQIPPQAVQQPPPIQAQYSPHHVQSPLVQVSQESSPYGASNHQDSYQNSYQDNYQDTYQNGRQDNSYQDSYQNVRQNGSDENLSSSQGPLLPPLMKGGQPSPLVRLTSNPQVQSTSSLAPTPSPSKAAAQTPPNSVNFTAIPLPTIPKGPALTPPNSVNSAPPQASPAKLPLNSTAPVPLIAPRPAPPRGGPKRAVSGSFDRNTINSGGPLSDRKPALPPKPKDLTLARTEGNE